MDSIWDRLQDWYIRKGISTEQFFGNNSTELGRDAMVMDFTNRMLMNEKDNIRMLRQIERCYEGRVDDLEAELKRAYQLLCVEVSTPYDAQRLEEEFPIGCDLNNEGE